jgi:hypothetical protein
VSVLLVVDKDLVLHVQTVLQIRLPRLLEDERWSLMSSIAINRWPWPLLRKSSKDTMAPLLDNFAILWSCVRPPECRAKVSSLRARRMLAKLGELHQSLYPRPARNPGAAWGSTCLDGPCEKGPDEVLEAMVLRRERPKVKLVPFGIL